MHARIQFFVAVMMTVGWSMASHPSHAQSPGTSPPEKSAPTKRFQNPFDPSALRDVKQPNVQAPGEVRRAGKTPKDSLFDFAEIEIDDQDDELHKLLKARYNAAVGEVQARLEEYRRGLCPVNVVCAAAQRVLISERELIEDPKRRAESFAKLIEIAKLVEQFAELNLNAGTGTTQDVFRARYLRLDAEIQQLKFQRSLKIERP